MKDARYKQLMTNFGMPDSASLLSILQQVAYEVAQEKDNIVWKTWQERVFKEKFQLDEKIRNLNMFLERKHDISSKHLELVKQQLNVMIEYSRILYDRIADFKGE